MGGRPAVCCPPAGADADAVVVGDEGAVDDGGGLLLEIRERASAITASARWRDCCRTVMLDCSVFWKSVRELISFCNVAMARCRACACD